jgi:long-subunit acyl-CoA synthetase (AMP-forming)
MRHALANDRIVGRAKDLIITGGLNVYPKEIEECIDALPGVAESAVIGLPDADFGEAVVAVVVAPPGHALTESGVIAALKGEIASFKVPRRVHVVADLPRNAMGKVQKNVLRDLISRARLIGARSAKGFPQHVGGEHVQQDRECALELPHRPAMRGTRADRGRDNARGHDRKQRRHVDVADRVRRQPALAESCDDEADRGGNGNRQT